MGLGLDFGAGRLSSTFAAAVSAPLHVSGHLFSSEARVPKHLPHRAAVGSRWGLIPGGPGAEQWPPRRLHFLPQPLQGAFLALLRVYSEMGC